MQSESVEVTVCVYMHVHGGDVGVHQGIEATENKYINEYDNSQQCFFLFLIVLLLIHHS